MLAAGIKGFNEITVKEADSAANVGSGLLNVYATPALVALMEKTAWESIAAELEEGSGTVGTMMNIKHVSATPIGMKVTCETELTEVNGRALKFAIRAYDEKGLIGEAEHERFIVYNAKFQAKADAKKNA